MIIIEIIIVILKLILKMFKIFAAVSTVSA